MSDLPLEAVPHPEAYRPRCRSFDVLVAADNVQHGSARAIATVARLTDSGRAALWVHDHLHESVDLARPGDTRIVCNPAGPRFGNAAFRDDLVVEV